MGGRRGRGQQTGVKVGREARPRGSSEESEGLQGKLFRSGNKSLIWATW